MAEHDNAPVSGQASEASNHTTRPYHHIGNTAAAQRARLLDYLYRHDTVTTLDARANLDVLHPAMRVLELRRAGHHIDTVWVHQSTQCGKLHRVARYVYRGKKGGVS